MLAAMLALLAYLRQRRFEILRTRYLDEGLDQAVRDIDRMLGVYSHNEAMMVSSMTHFKRMGERGPELALATCTKGLQRLEPFLATYPYFRTRILLRDDFFWEAAQVVREFVVRYERSIDTLWAAHLEKSLGRPYSETQTDHEYQVYLEEFDQLSEKAETFLPLSEALQEIGFALQERIYSLGSDLLEEFHEDERVVSVMRRVRGTFPEIATRVCKLEN